MEKTSLIVKNFLSVAKMASTAYETESCVAKMASTAYETESCDAGTLKSLLVNHINYNSTIVIGFKNSYFPLIH